MMLDFEVEIELISRLIAVGTWLSHLTVVKLISRRLIGKWVLILSLLMSVNRLMVVLRWLLSELDRLKGV